MDYSVKRFSVIQYENGQCVRDDICNFVLRSGIRARVSEKTSSIDFDEETAVAEFGEGHKCILTYQILRAWRDYVRTVKWEEIFPYPSVSLQQMRQLLSIVA
jgi:hypothetical protein